MENLINKTHNIHYLDLLAKIPDNTINLITSDFPYGTTKNDWDIPFDLKKVWAEYERIIKDDGAILLFAQSPFDKVLACSNLQLFRYEWIWEKAQATGFLNAEKMPLKAHENILVFYKKLPTYNPIKTKGHRKVSKKASQDKCIQSPNYGKHYFRSDYDSDERYPRSVLYFPTDKQKEKLHPTKKPIELQKYLIETYSNEGDIVHDSCSGSGTTECACILLNRNFICSENNKKFYEISLKRQEKYRGEVGLFEMDAV